MSVGLSAWYILESRRRRRLLEGALDERTREAGFHQAQAERAHRELESLLLRVTSDLRQPLDNLVGAMDLITAVREDPPAVSRWVAHGRTCGRRLAVMIDDLIAHARFETDRDGEVRLESVDVVAAVQGAIATAISTEQGVGEHRVVYPVFDQRGRAVLAEPNRLHQLLTDLVINAMEHSKPGPIVVRCTDGDLPHSTNIAVIDPGSDLQVEELLALSEPYRRGEQADRPGLGLGLAVAQRVAEQFGTNLRVQAGAGETRVAVRLNTPEAMLVSEQRPGSAPLRRPSLVIDLVSAESESGIPRQGLRG